MKAENAPLVSVVMSVRNCAATVNRAIKSILQQSQRDFEFIIIDDGSTDATAAAIGRWHDPRIRFCARGEQRGLAARLNEGVAMARGSYIARMDGDDFSYPERFERQVGFLESHPGVDLVGAAGVAFRSTGAAIGAFRIATAHEDICRRPEVGFVLPHPTWLGRAAWFRRFPYPETALRAQDQATLLKAYTASRFANIADPLIGYHQDIPTLRSIVLGRWHYAKAILREGRATRNRALVLAGLSQQLARGVITVPPLLIGGGNRLLTSRFRPLSEPERARFERIRDGLA